MCVGTLLLILVGNSINLSYSDHELGIMFGRTEPIINEPNLEVEEAVQGLSLPTRIAFVGPDDILVIEKNNGTVSRILNGTISSQPILDVNVNNELERGMVGIAISENEYGPSMEYLKAQYSS